MGDVVASPIILLPVLLCGLTTFRAANLCSPDSSIGQCKLENVGTKKRPRCPICGTDLEFVIFFKKDPPWPSEKWDFGTKFDDWNYLCAS
jgi:hypothetical protein